MFEPDLHSSKIEALCATGAWPWQLPFERNTMAIIICAMAIAAGLENVKIEIRFVSDAEMARINAECLECAGPTNVITFPRREEGICGIAVSLDCLHREALLYGQKPEVHLIRLLAHGFGHLGDFRHGAPLDRIQADCENVALQLVRELPGMDGMAASC